MPRIHDVWVKNFRGRRSCSSCGLCTGLRASLLTSACRCMLELQPCCMHIGKPCMLFMARTCPSGYPLDLVCSDLHRISDSRPDSMVLILRLSTSPHCLSGHGANSQSFLQNSGIRDPRASYIYIFTHIHCI